MSFQRKPKSTMREYTKKEREETEIKMEEVEGVRYKDDPQEDFHVQILMLIACVVFIIIFIPRRYSSTISLQDYYETNGMIAVAMLVPLMYVIGYFPEMCQHWKSAYQKWKVHKVMNFEEKEHLIALFTCVIAVVVFFGIVDFSFLRVKEGIPQLGSVALLGLWGFFRNVYKLRKANWQERKRIRDHEKHIEEIRSRRNPPSEK